MSGVRTLGSGAPLSAAPQSADAPHPDDLRAKVAGGLWPLFARQVAARPDAPALLGDTGTGTGTLSYAELATRAEAIAAALAARGVGRGDMVGLLASRSGLAVAAMLGCIRAGAAYVPLDPTHAPEQLAFIARDLPLKAALVAPRHANRAPDVLPEGLPALPLSALPLDALPHAPVPPLPEASGEDPAYVMYTSGTTGQPKGVVVAQRGVAGIALAQALLDPRPDDRMLHAGTIAADGSTFEIWGALLNGAALAVVEAEKPGLDEIARVMRTQKVTFALWYAGLHHLMIDHQIDAFASLRKSVSGGDTVSPAHAKKLLQAWPGLSFVNVFGPTETTVVTLGLEVTPEMLGPASQGGALPIGRPLAGEEVFVVGEDLAPLPPGETGQMVFAGLGVALGYHGRPEKTAEVFVEDPRPGRHGKVYLTGDLATRRPDGAFDFHGRADRMVKLHGRRIELDGIEHLLRADPRVNEAVVEVVTVAGDKRLACALRPEGAVTDPAAFARDVLATAGAGLNPAELPRLTRVLADFPMTPAGKVDRPALRKLLSAATFPAAAPAVTARDTRATIAAIWDRILGCGPLPDSATFFDAGGSSLQLIDAHAAIEKALGVKFDITEMFDTPTLGALSARLSRHTAEEARAEEAPRPASGAIAIVGRAARLPGAGSLQDFWQAIRDGRSLIRHFAPEEMEDAFTPEERARPNYVRARGIVEGAELFDAKFFGILPRDAAEMDPQARVFLETCHAALEDAGLDPARPPGPVGIFGGASPSTYLWHNLLSDRATADRLATDYQLANFPVVTGNTPDALTTRIAHKLNLTGPALNISTACSTSLVAIAQAVTALRAGQCDAALAGGVSLTFPQKRGYLAVEGGMASPDGLCRPFDAEARGTVFSQGAGAVVLKRLEDAQAAGDRILGVIRGVGINNDGAGKIAFTAPSVGGQAAAIAMAHRDAGLDPATISYVECHGTATPLGDPIEVAGLARAFGPGAAGSCALGSVKGTIGHLDAAAGVMGVLKTTLMFEAGEIPPVANFRAPNPRIDFAATPFRVPSAPEAWSKDAPRRAGVSAFGVGGTNVHLVIEEPPAIAAAVLPGAPQVLPLSARTPEALSEMAGALATALEGPDAPALPDAAFTLQEGRQAHSHRLAVAARTGAEAAALLRKAAPRAVTEPPEMIFLFPGQGSQYPGMGKGLYATEPAFARVIDEGCEILSDLIDIDMAELLCFGEVSDAAQARALRDTRITQPALYLTQLAAARLWQERGVEPSALIGHSVGEFAAATLAGVMSFETGLRIIAERGRLMQDMAPGAMLGIRAPAGQVMGLLGDGIDLAALNAPNLQVVAGPEPAIEALAKRLEARGTPCSRLHTSHAFHSAMMDPVVPALEAMIAGRALHAPDRPIHSAVTGQRLTDAQATDPAFWAGQARATVKFQAALEAATKSGSPVLIEVGAGRTLSAFAGQILKRGGPGRIFQSLPDHTQTDLDDQSVMAAAFSNLWASGVAVDFARLPRGARKVALPTYAFQRKRHWIDPPATDAAPGAAAGAPVVAAAAMSSPAASPPASAPIPAPVPPTAQAAAASSSPAPSVSETAMTARLDRLTSELLALFADLSGEDMGPDEAGVPFLELGFDSLFMGQVAQALGRDYGVEMTFRSLLSDTPSIAELATHLDAVLPPEAAAPQAPATPMAAEPPVTAAPVKAAHATGDNATGAPVAAPAPAAMTGSVPAMPAAEGLTGLMQAQMQTMQAIFADQLRALGAAPAPAHPAAAQPAPAQAPAPAQPSPAQPAPSAPAARVLAPKAEEVAADEAPAEKQGFKVGRGPNLAGVELTADQHAFVADLARRYSERHARSKAYTAQHRPHLADPRTAAGFHPDWKELAFPIVSDRSSGATLTDIDGHSFIDVVNGFGQTAFGHSPAFVSAAVAAQLDRGYAIGPQSEKAGPLADRLSTMLGHERVTFANTGSEAVMAAMRLARTVTGRDKVVVFGNDYHGQFDEVLVKGKTRGEPAALPIAPGIPRSGLSNMVVLPYGADESLDWIRANAGQIAAVLVEPVQSRHPEFRPEAFVRALREITAESGAALIMDEVVTGFRTHAKGMQGIWGIEPDMATYGKVVGGGMPIGLLAGKARFMDALDGGQWSFGDDSTPQVGPTFVAGTFVRHPLVLAAVEAVLDHLDAEGDRLWHETASLTADMIARLNAVLVQRGLPALVTGFSSWFMLNATQADPRASLLYPLMRMEGIHVLDGFAGFLTTAHTEADVARIVTAFASAVDQLQAVGILAPSQPVTAATEVPSRAIPLTEGQREIWMTHQLGDMAACAFNEGACLRLDGPLDRRALTRALDGVIARHDALRLVFDRSGGSFDVAAPAPLVLDLTDLSAEADPEAALTAALREDAATPFDLTAGPAFRAHLYRLAEGTHVLAMTAHHILCDGWSYNLIFADLAALYAGETLAPAPSFAAYAMNAAGRAMSAQTLDFWRAQYARIPALPDLPTDRPRPAVKGYAGGTVTGQIPADAMKALRKAGAKAGCTLFATLFAGLQMTLGRLSGASDVVIGVPTAGQADLPDPALVGHMVNFLPIRAPFDPAKPAAEHLANASRAVMEAFSHGDTTYGALVRELGVPRSLGRLPLTEVQFNLEKVDDGLTLGPVTARATPAPKAASNFDLFFNVIESKAGLRIDVDYNADVYDAATVERWIGHYAALLAGLAEDATRPIQTLPMMDAATLGALLAAPNATALDYDRGAMLHDLVTRGAAPDPRAIAVEAADATLTHAELSARSDALAAHIQASLPEPGQRIAMALPRGAAMLVGLIAILKAGHSYIPLDPRQPADRLRTICETAEAAAVLAEEAPFTRLPLIRPSEAPTQATPAATPADPERAAYIIFTSGSTGTPKGVAVPHRAVVNFLTSMAQEPGLSPSDAMLSVTTVMFDIAVLELFGPLAVGAKVVIASHEDILDGFALADRAARGDITVMQATPTLWDMALEAGLEPRAGLKMLAGGEPLPADLATRLRADGGGELWNLYGPTETTIWSAVKRVGDGPVTIGHPIGNTELHILSEADQLQPVGVVGELNIGGDGLALGYYGRPELTEAAFREVSLAGTPRRLYRTGDLAYRRADGDVVVLGRRDTQVKLRGFRIELGEIETRLRTLPGIAKAAVDLATRPGGDKFLAAWYVAEEGAQVDAAALHAALAGQLPDYMVPQAWQRLDALPQTANGKLDRKALPQPTATQPATAQPTAAQPGHPEAGAAPATLTPASDLAPVPAPADTPTGATETKIAAIWCDVLGRETVGATITLHALGVDSLAVFRIAARMLDAGLNLEARDLLAHPTIRTLAAEADRRAAEAQSRTGTDAPARPSLKSFRGGARRGELKVS
ncbi:non-ribosomal peptide synthetase/type I polyketide synthase [Acidimangrovimonas sediminis]|uniref:non-ribosomal peptide synthetase/type I polyketide synthase n=1 Tax=Acidimangrovimonas sediminis TaxID=2056283 RepID=UPI0011AF2F73|nr:non-ribosomal peptide synthetase/type I polyketide synthase [Acidimangrovimonas sediminis]